MRARRSCSCPNSAELTVPRSIRQQAKIRGEEVAGVALREARPKQSLDDRREDQRQDDAEIVIHDGLKTDGHLRVHRNGSNKEQHAGLRVERNPALPGDREAEEEKADEQ